MTVSTDLGHGSAPLSGDKRSSGQSLSFVILWQALPGRSRGPPMTAFTDLGQESAYMHGYGTNKDKT